MNKQREEKIKSLDKEIKYIFSSKDNLRHFYVSLAVHYFTMIIFGTIEIYLIIIFMQGNSNFSFIDSFFIYIFGFILTNALFFMPAGIGTSEGAYSLALHLLGYDPQLGISLGIIRRLRTFVWSGIGFIILFFGGFFKDRKIVIDDGQ